MRTKFVVGLTKRDLEILQFTFEQRAVSCKQLSKKFFSNTSFQTAHARLERLRLAKFLVKSYTLWKNKRTVVYGITEKGIKAFAENYDYQIEKHNYKSDSINHDIGLVLVRERLEKLAVVKRYLSESMLQNCSDLFNDEKFMGFTLSNSDGAIDIEMPNGKFQLAVEYEISGKQSARYVSKLSEYYYSYNISSVLYICGNARIEKLIHKADSEVRGEKKSKIFTCLEETFYNLEENLNFFSTDDRVIKLT